MDPPPSSTTTTTTPPSMHFDVGSSGPCVDAIETLGKCHGSHSYDRIDKYNDNDPPTPLVHFDASSLTSCRFCVK